MKLPRLPEIDLARIAPLDRDSKRRALMQFKAGSGPWSYDPARSQIPNIFQPTTPLGLPIQSVDWAKIEQEIRRACKRGEEQLNSNLEVTQLLFDWARNRQISSAHVPFSSLSLGHEEKVRYWGNFVSDIEGTRTVPFFDHRRGRGLTSPHALRFAFSVMHQQIRVQNPDFADYDLVIFQFPMNGEKRYLRPLFAGDVQLFDFDTLDQMVRETYEMWAEINEERRRGGGGGVPKSTGFSF